MGRTRKSKVDPAPAQTKSTVKQEVKIPIMEEPLMIFVCRRCNGNFNSNEEYQGHDCPEQTYAVICEDTQEEPVASPKKTRKPRASPKKKKVEEEIKGEEDEATALIECIDMEVKKQKPRKARTKKQKEESEPIACKTCGKSFTRKYHLDRHLVHTSCNPGNLTREEYNCEVCGKIFSRVDNLRMHLRAHLGVKSRSRDFQCPYCEKAFYGSSLLNIHIRSHTKEKPYLCDWKDCGKGFPSSGALTKHRRVHTGEKPYQCKTCGNRFAAKETLNRHVRTHTGRRDHTCRICGKSFIQNSQLKAHLFHHTGEFAITCDLCGKQFNRKSRMREHIEYLHLKKNMPTCHMCSKKFMRREDLNRHIESHVGERTHQCEICDKKFVTKAAQKIHSRIHSIEDPARCSYCNRDFLRMDCLVRHVRSKHRDTLQQIIIEAETNRILSAQTKKEGDELEIIVYKEAPKEEEEEGHFEVLEVAGEDEMDSTPIFLDDELLKKRVQELLEIVIEESLLKELGYGKKPVDEVLCSVLEQCSRTPIKKTDGGDDSSRMRENTKLLFSMVLDEDHIKSLLNNYTVDEVITIVLKMAK